MSRRLASWFLLFTTLIFTSVTSFAQSVTVYSYRQPFLIEPLLQKFTQQTGIEVELVFSKKGLVERIAREGRLSPADVLLTSDFSRLQDFVDAGLAANVDNLYLTENIPSQLRSPDNNWFALTVRTRGLYTSKTRIGDEAINYEDLADPKYRGKICTRSGKHPYNVALVASMIAQHGEIKTKDWLLGVKANLARKPQGNDRAQVKAVKEGLCDIAIGNSYYLGKMLNDPRQITWADAVNIRFPNQNNRGTHVNVSGMALALHAKNQPQAIKLMEFLASDEAQYLYAKTNYEYPVKADVKISEIVASWGEFKADELPIQALADHHSQAVKLLDQVQFDI